MSEKDPFAEFGGQVTEDPFAEFGGGSQEQSFAEMIPNAPRDEKTIIGDIQSFFKDPSFEKLKTFGDDTPTASALKGGLKSAYFGFDDSIVGALGGDKEKYKSEQDRLEKLNPKSFLTGEIGSALATPAGAITALKSIPGLAKLAEKSPKLAKALAGMTAGAAQGGVAGAGYGDENAMEGATTGASIGAALPLAGAGISKAREFLPKGSSVFKLASGLSDLEYDVAKTKDLSTAKSPEQMGAFYQEISDTLGKQTQEAGEKVKSATTKLEDLIGVPGVGAPMGGLTAKGGAVKDTVSPPPGTLSREDLASALQSLIKGDEKFPGLADFRPKTGKFEFVNPDTKKVLTQIQRQVNQTLKGMDQFIPEDRVMGMVDQLTSSINYDKDSNLKQKIIKGFASKVKDEVYSRNPQLAEAKGVAQQAIELENLGKKILAPSTEWQKSQKITLPSDTTKRVEPRLLNPESFTTKRFADRLKAATGLDLEDEALKRYVSESTKGGTPTGFWDRYGIQKAAELTALGGIGAGAGYAADSSFGGSASGTGIGLTLGLLRQRYGKRLGAEILQKIQKKNATAASTMNKSQMLKLANDYVKGGNKKLAATMYVLSQRDRNLREGDEE